MDVTHFQRAYFNETYLDPIAAVILVLMGLATLGVSRRYAVWPLIVITCCITQAQRVSVFTLDFPFLRIMAMFGIARVVMRAEYQGFRWNGLDFAVLGFMGLRWAFTAVGIKTAGTFVAMGGEALDMWGLYFFFRCVVRDFGDFRATIYGFILISIPLSVAFIYEHTALKNPFSIFGGVSDVTRNRDGKLRCMGAYSHPILAGCFWAVLLPYMGSMIRQKGRITFLPLIGIACASIIIITSGSSTPIAGAGLAFLAGCLFLFRSRLKLIRWTGITLMILAQLVMANGVAHLLARTDLVGGSTGYYRYKLIDQFLGHWQEWLVIGSKKGTSSWAVPMFDIVNYYVVMGLAGGLLFVIALLALLLFAFRNVGRLRKTVHGNVEAELTAWAIGVGIFVHAMIFLAVTYYGQIVMIWYFSLAITGVVSGMQSGRGGGFFMGQRRMDPLSRLAGRPMMVR